MAQFWISLVAGGTGGVLAVAGQFVADRLTRARERRGKRRDLVADLLALAMVVHNDVLVSRTADRLNVARLDVNQQQLFRTIIELRWLSEGRLREAVKALGDAVGASVVDWQDAALDGSFEKALEDLRQLGADLPS